ncbi:MAG: urea transporter [Gammaproteobacteria bacterium]|nr:urea transporter [Gammaproteobacteria bacterium]
MNKQQTNRIGSLHDNILGVLRAYATILFLNHPVTGLIILVSTLFFPNLGIAGLIGAVTGLVLARFLNFPQISSGMHIYNSLLVGLSLGAFFQLDYYLIMLIVLGSVLAVFLTVALATALWRHDELPVLSLPFVIVAMTMAFAARSYQSLEYYIAPYAAAGDFINVCADTFLSSMGSIFFMANPMAGLVLFVIIFIHSRYLALLALGGYIVGYALLIFLTGNMNPNLAVWSGFNFALTAMAVGGIFTIPGVYGFIVAMLSAALAALVTTAMQNLLLGYGLPVMAFPFLITTLTVLAALRRRIGLSAPYMAPIPALPEINFERARLAKVRNGEIGSIPLLSPFYGEWDIYQGFNGEHTHKAPWQHALDFYMLEQGKSFSADGLELEDFYCYGLPVLSPAYGEVIRTYDRFNDNKPGEMDTSNNWGNFILIRLDTGAHVLLAHLKKSSIKVREKDRVEPGVVLAACGNSGRSPQPHLHLQTQHDAALGAPTVPFHLASVVVDDNKAEPSYKVVSRPEKGDLVQPAENDDKLARNLHLPVGRSLNYKMQCGNSEQFIERKMHVEVTLIGQYRFKSDSGASAAFEENNGVLAFYDRTGPKDVVLDGWLLANGLTPLTDKAFNWLDSPPVSLLPLSFMQRLWLNIRYPMGCGLHSQYQRNWNKADNHWLQSASHQLNKTWRANTRSIISADKGCVAYSLEFNNQIYTAELTDIGLVSDAGIPGWRESVSGKTKL